MSQVVVTVDALKARREKSLNQEHTIEREAGYAQWRLSDATKTHPVAKLIGIAILPIMVLWGLLMATMGVALSITLGLFKVLGAVIGGGGGRGADRKR